MSDPTRVSLQVSETPARGPARVLRDPDGNEFCVIDSPDLGEAPDE